MSTDFSFQEGDQFRWERHVSAEDVKQFAEIVGDLNPIHLDPEFAANSSFKKRIVHGAFLAGLISKVLGMDFPGQGTVYISQNSVFKRPVYGLPVRVGYRLASGIILLDSRPFPCENSETECSLEYLPKPGRL